VCMVPHMFLYYFSEEDFDAPRGIIDMEYYTNVVVEDNVVSLHADKSLGARPLHFKIHDPDVRKQWIHSMKRDRFQTVQDERDMYQQLQEQFSGQMNSTTKMIDDHSQEKEQLLREIAESRKVSEDAMVMLYRLVGLMDEVGPEESASGDMAVLGHCLEREIKLLKENHVKFLDDSSKERDRQLIEMRIKIDALEQSNEKLERRLATESLTLGTTEKRLAQEREDAEVRYRGALAQLEEASSSLQSAVLEKQDGQEKVAGLMSQKKLLIKEVKSLRKKEEEHLASIASLKSEVEALKNALEEKVRQVPNSASNSEHDAATLASADQGAISESESQSSDSFGNSTRRGSVMATLGSVFKLKGNPDSSETANKTENGNNARHSTEDTTKTESSTGFVLNCYRCGGTVEGPQYSTCKCAEPALTPEDVTSRKPASRRLSQMTSQMTASMTAQLSSGGKLFSSMLGRGNKDRDTNTNNGVDEELKPSAAIQFDPMTSRAEAETVVEVRADDVEIDAGRQSTTSNCSVVEA